ncbi:MULTISPECIES: tripartite tricarboxylate transporter TctB family protein [Marivita]|uniref:Tripartite tricarboxylate transporter TctB family protein n=1 Tax=Marivita cryptomonadis TaxID=505252 RepID=A0A9Q2PBS1_9RHOB|nr:MULTISPECIES: tripartite tricarboxylate transporter TctB family protein [Marivita]MCR9168418.1 tripartite tricarboxylate transporter TctB family protein [Paracoccaceae bacterium]MBM2321834.1 tripartite tricarboxylate transporter TctB family protein [Marivita cryptomonadis]MBM2331539.1 tripartite tricarboxylate transporter TctB family protein [Marivita cryptomonadis]MBM2341125.1 tripartite tricarboxylate transporter TctB family protein [Marivita cryptomonadis]MBM2345787.1 tripartite tricarbo
MPSDHHKPPRQIGGELVIPILAVGFTIYFFSTIWNSPWTAQVSAFIVGGILLLVCAIFFVRAGIWLVRGEGTLGVGNLFTMDDIRTGRIGLLVTTIAYVMFIDTLGFTLMTFLFLAASMLILAKGKNAGFITMISAAMALTGWAVFIWAFDTRFPRGWFETTMKAVLANG